MTVVDLFAKQQWYVLIVRNGKEKKIKEKLMIELELFEEDFVIPEFIEPDELENLISVEIKKDLINELNERKKLFSGYFFLRVILNQFNYGKILETESVYEFLGITEGKLIKPSFVPEDQINRVKEYLLCKKINRKVTDDLKIGDQVIIISGDLRDIQGKITELHNEYVKILPISFFQKTIKVARNCIIKN